MFSKMLCRNPSFQLNRAHSSFFAKFYYNNCKQLPITPYKAHINEISVLIRNAKQDLFAEKLNRKDILEKQKIYLFDSDNN